MARRAGGPATAWRARWARASPVRHPAPSSVLQPSIHLQYCRSPCFPARLLTNEVCWRL